MLSRAIILRALLVMAASLLFVVVGVACGADEGEEPAQPQAAQAAADPAAPSAPSDQAPRSAEGRPRGGHAASRPGRCRGRGPQGCRYAGPGLQTLNYKDRPNNSPA